MTNHSIMVTVNGRERRLNVPSHRTLLETLRDQLGMAETKYGCGTGECGACTVLVDGKNVLSCLTLAAEADGHEVTTAAGLAEEDELHPIQQAFIDEAAVQCGYCTPGLVIKTAALLSKIPNPTEEEICKELEGNICRCTGYTKVIKAVQNASQTMRAGVNTAAE